ncbi:MAG: hypothetical protein R3B35_12305 [Gemmatimonadales bacterium]
MADLPAVPPPPFAPGIAQARDRYGLAFLLWLTATLLAACSSTIVEPNPLGVTISGTLTAVATAEPVGGARVTVEYLPQCDGSWAARDQATTGSNGQYLLRFAPNLASPACLRIVTSKADFRPDTFVVSSPTLGPPPDYPVLTVDRELVRAET